MTEYKRKTRVPQFSSKKNPQWPKELPLYLTDRAMLRPNSLNVSLVDSQNPNHSICFQGTTYNFFYHHYLPTHAPLKCCFWLIDFLSASASSYFPITLTYSRTNYSTSGPLWSPRLQQISFACGANTYFLHMPFILFNCPISKIPNPSILLFDSYLLSLILHFYH